MSTPNDPLLLAEGLEKSLGGTPIVKGVDLRCEAGAVLGLLGPNGAGKTTTLRMCYGFLSPDAGYVRIAGHDIQRQPDAARHALGVCTQDDTFDGDFGVRDNLLQAGRYFRPHIPDLSHRVDELMERFGLQTYAKHIPEELSGGYRRRLMIARSVVHRPKVVFLDEPTTGLDPHARVAVWDLISNLRREGMAIVLTTHYMDEAERLSDHLSVLQAGKVRAKGLTNEVLGDVVGDHIVVIGDGHGDSAPVKAWIDGRGARAAKVLEDWHVPLDGGGLADFAAAFPDLRYEVRTPTLDDLFLALSAEAQQ